MSKQLSSRQFGRYGDDAMFRENEPNQWALTKLNLSNGSDRYLELRLSAMQLRNNSTVKPVKSGHSKRRPKIVFKTAYRLMHVKSIAECSKGRGAFCNTFDLH